MISAVTNISANRLIRTIAKIDKDLQDAASQGDVVARLESADVAKEMAAVVKLQIQKEIAASPLSQSFASQELVVKLLLTSK